MRDGEPERAALVAHLDPLEIEGVVAELDATADERVVDLVAVAVQGDGRRLGDGALLGPEEGLPQQLRLVTGVGAAGRARRVARERRLLRLVVHACVVGLLQPGAEEAVELVERGELAPGQLDEEVITDAAKQPFELAPALGPAGCGVHEPDAEHGADPLQLAGGEGRAVVDIQDVGEAEREEGGPEHALQGERRLRPVEAGGGLTIVFRPGMTSSENRCPLFGIMP